MATRPLTKQPCAMRVVIPVRSPWRAKVGCHPSCLIFLFALLLPCSGQLTEDTLGKLASDDFKVREQAEQDLTQWAFENREKADEDLLRHTREHPVAEVRIRCLSVLKRVVLDGYDADGEGYVGIRMMDEVVRLPDQEEPVAGLLVSTVMPDSPAAKGGLQDGDYILALDKAAWKGMPASEDFRSRVKAMKPRTEVVLKVLRGKELLEIRVRLARRPAALENPFDMPDQERIDALENERKEEYFKKWLLQRRNGR